MKACTACRSPLTADSTQPLCASCHSDAALTVEAPVSTEEAETQGADAAPLGVGRSSSIPRQLGPIRLVRCIGKGGMGEVWLGQHELLGRDVAVKFLLGAVVDERDPAFTTFIQGARVAASLEHAGLNKIYHADVAEGIPYLVLELLDGPNLGELVGRSGPLDLPTARAVLEAAGEAVAELNQHDLIHRDLKPSNIVLTTDGRVVVTDFGLACARPASVFGGASGGVAGTPAYMAPEMFDGVVSAKTDVYALGMTAYHLLSGRAAFAGELEEQRRQHREVTLDVQPLLAAGVPQSVVDVVVRATGKDALFRPKTAWHVLEALRAAFTAAGIQRASRDDLARSLKLRMQGKSGATEAQAGPEQSSSYSETISEVASRKRGLRAAAAVDSAAPIPALPAVWPSVQNGQPASGGAPAMLSYGVTPKQPVWSYGLAFVIGEVLASVVVVSLMLAYMAMAPVVPHFPRSLCIALLIAIASGLARLRRKRPRAWRRSAILFVGVWVIVLAGGLLGIYYSGGGKEYFHNLQRRSAAFDGAM